MTEVYAALEAAHAYFQALAPESWVPDYLNRRNMYRQLVPAELGYGGRGRTDLIGYLRQHGYDDVTIEQAGLAYRAESGELLGRFRDRLTFPLRDGDGTLVGFTARINPRFEAVGDKYVNSPASAIFNKRAILYGLHDREQVDRGGLPLLVEGPTDRLAIKIAAPAYRVVPVAPCGTSFTREQAALLVAAAGSSRPIAVGLDPDRAGRKGTIRAWEHLTDAGARNLVHVRWSGGKDPGELVRSGRREQLRDAIRNHRPLHRTITDLRIAEAGPLDDHVGRRIRLARHLITNDLYRLHPDQIDRYLTHLEQRLDLDSATIAAIVTDAASTRRAEFQ